MGDGRNANGQFTKGNKFGGRKREPKEFKQRTVELSGKVLNRFEEIIDDPYSDPKDVIAVGKIIIERAYGKPHVETGEDAQAGLSRLDRLLEEITNAAQS